MCGLSGPSSQTLLFYKKYCSSPAGESDDTRFIIMSRKGDEVQLAPETAMKAKVAEELDGF